MISDINNGYENQIKYREDVIKKSIIEFNNSPKTFDVFTQEFIEIIQCLKHKYIDNIMKGMIRWLFIIFNDKRPLNEIENLFNFTKENCKMFVNHNIVEFDLEEDELAINFNNTLPWIFISNINEMPSRMVQDYYEDEVRKTEFYFSHVMGYYFVDILYKNYINQLILDSTNVYYYILMCNKRCKFFPKDMIKMIITHIKNLFYNEINYQMIVKNVKKFEPMESEEKLGVSFACDFKKEIEDIQLYEKYKYNKHYYFIRMLHSEFKTFKSAVGMSYTFKL